MDAPTQSEDTSEQPAVADGWQPIETAPKDGRRVLVWIDEGKRSQIAFARLWFYEDGRLGGGADGFNGKWNITHWMPMPAAPSSQQVKKEGCDENV